MTTQPNKVLQHKKCLGILGMGFGKIDWICMKCGEMEEFKHIPFCSKMEGPDFVMPSSVQKIEYTEEAEYEAAVEYFNCFISPDEEYKHYTLDSFLSDKWTKDYYPRAYAKHKEKRASK